MFLEPEDEWQPMLSIPLEAAVDDESCRARTDLSDAKVPSLTPLQVL